MFDQFMVFVIIEDYVWQEQVFEGLYYNCELWIICCDMIVVNVFVVDWCVVFVGVDVYVEVGGNIICDLFSEDWGGFFEDVGLFDMFVVEKLCEIVGEVQVEGWKWVEVYIDYFYVYGMWCFYLQFVVLFDENEVWLEVLFIEYDEFVEGYLFYDEMFEDVVQKLEVIFDEIDVIFEKCYVYDFNVIVYGGVFVVFYYDGMVRIECGFV